MATEKQIAANRRNAQSSTGPRSAEGKAASSRNALKTGLYCRGIIIGHESSDQLEALEAAYTAEYAPATPDRARPRRPPIHYEWLLRRYRWLETETWHATQDLLTPASLPRNPRRAPSPPSRARASDPAPDTATDASEVSEPIEIRTVPSEIGFVPSNRCVDADPLRTPMQDTAHRT